MSLIRALMIDVEGVLVCGRPSDGRPWASTIEDDLGLSVAALQQEFFSPYWNEIVLGRAAPVDHLKPVLAKIAPHLPYDDFIAYWFENDARLNIKLLEELRQQRKAGKESIWQLTKSTSGRRISLKHLGLAAIVTASIIRQP